MTNHSDITTQTSDNYAFIFKYIYNEMIKSIEKFFNDAMEYGDIDNWSNQKTKEFIILNKVKICICVNSMMIDYLIDDVYIDIDDDDDITGEYELVNCLNSEKINEYLFNEDDFGIIFPKLNNQSNDDGIEDDEEEEINDDEEDNEEEEDDIELEDYKDIKPSEIPLINIDNDN